MRKTLATIGLAAAIGTTGTLAAFGGSATATEDNPNPQGRGTAAASVDEADVKVFKCDGGRSVNMRSRIVNRPFTFVETGTNAEDQAIPGAKLALKGPNRGRDTLLVTFSGESDLDGGTDADWMGIEVHLDGNPIQPWSNPDPYAFTGESSWNSHSAQFCVKVGPGKHRLQAFTNLYDGGSASTLDGWLDDYTFVVERFN